MRTIQDIPDLSNKKVLLRVDFDVPVADGGAIVEPFRIQKQKETLDYLVAAGARVVMVAHISAVETFQALIPKLGTLLNQNVVFISNPDEIPRYLDNHPGVGLLDNVRRFQGEVSNDSEFAKRLASGFDYYINNAFAVVHRSQASVSAITKLLPSYAGLLLQTEVLELQKALAAPSVGRVVIIGGSKASTKVPMIQNFLGKADAIILGGIVANDVLKVLGMDIGSSKIDENLQEVLGTLDVKSDKLVLPHDFNMLENKIYDIGPQTIDKFENIVRRAKMIIWNGPMGRFEDKNYSAGTDAIARAIIASGAPSVVGGGDTVAAVNRLGVLDKFTFVSTGGGAMLEFLAGHNLPGILALQ